MIIKPSCRLLGFVFTKMFKKYCPKCKREKGLFEFNKNKNKVNGVGSYCRECTSFINKLDSKKHREQEARNASVWRNKNKEKFRAIKKRCEDRCKYDFVKFVNNMHRRMRHRISKEPNYVGLPICSKEEFVSFAIKNKRLKLLFDRWVESGNYLWLKPSVDRKINNLGYSIDNIQILTHYENTCKQTRDYVSIPLLAEGERFITFKQGQ